MLLFKKLHITLLSDHMESLHTGPYCTKTHILHQRRQMGLHHNIQPVVATSGNTKFLES